MKKIILTIYTRISLFLFRIVEPKSKKEDSKRREFILNVILLGSIVFTLFLFLRLLIDIIIRGDGYRGGSLGIPLVVLVIFVVLFGLSRLKLFKLSAVILLLLYFLVTTYTLYSWGADIPQGLITYALIIVMTSVLINTFSGMVVTFIIALVLVVLTYLQENGIVIPNLYWTQDTVPKMDDAITTVITFCIIMLISWLSNREIEKSLKRARRSERELKIERDSLEIKVEERTSELKKTQMEKMAQLYRFAEFGRLSSGLFHDLVNPLTALSLNLGQVKDETNSKVREAKSYLGKAIKTTKRMEDFVIAVRKQIQKQETSINFSLTEEIIQCIQVFSYKARKANVEIIFNPLENISTYGDAIKFSQVVMNLVSNSIDACEMSKDNNKKKKVEIVLWKKNKMAYLTIEDNGSGIKEENLEKVWDPFFTTKGFDKGTGIGLSSTKNIIEKIFNGHISINTEVGKGTKFKIRFLLKDIIKKSE
jgi:signal transduction histidine kinase